MTPWPRSPLTQRAFVNSPRSLRSSGKLWVHPPRGMPLPPTARGPRPPRTQGAFVPPPRSLRSSGNLEVYPPMPMPLPLPDRVEIAEYLAPYVLRDIEARGLTE